MKQAWRRRLAWALACAAVWGAAALVFFAAPRGQSACYEAQTAAAKKMAACLEEMALARSPLNRSDDLNGTGLIGDAFSDMTTTLGSLESKRTAATPDAAAMIVKLLWDLNLPKGARLAVNMSGSFPGFNIAALCAAEALGYRATAVASLGASTYGANTLEWNYLRMHERLRKAGLLQTPLSAASVGGGRDAGAGMPGEDAAAFLRQDILQNGVPLIEKENFLDNLLARREILGPAEAYINIGGNWTGGVSPGMETLPAGVIRPGEAALPRESDGLIARYLADGVPCLNLLNVKGLCAQTGLPYDPAPLPPIGASDVYYEKTPSRLAAGAALLLGIGAAALLRPGVPRRMKDWLFHGKQCNIR